MTTTPRPFPPALPHSSLREVLPGIYFVTGSIDMPGRLPVRFSRNMTIVKEGERLVLINTVRLDEKGLAALDALGRVTDVIRLAGNHGMDDPFYKDRYSAKVWVVRGQRYKAGFTSNSPDTYFTPDIEMDAATALPLAGAKLYVIDSKPPEGILVLPQHNGVAIAGDCLQHWHKSDPYFSLLAKLMMPLMGFIKPYNVGPAWLKACKPPADQMRGILNLQFANVLPSHGDVVLGDAVTHYRPAIERATSS
jgi:hypothetical protein